MTLQYFEPLRVTVYLHMTSRLIKMHVIYLFIKFCTIQCSILKTFQSCHSQHFPQWIILFCYGQYDTWDRSSLPLRRWILQPHEAVHVWYVLFSAALLHPCWCTLIQSTVLSYDVFENAYTRSLTPCKVYSMRPNLWNFIYLFTVSACVDAIYSLKYDSVKVPCRCYLENVSVMTHFL